MSDDPERMVYDADTLELASKAMAAAEARIQDLHLRLNAETKRADSWRLACHEEEARRKALEVRIRDAVDLLDPEGER